MKENKPSLDYFRYIDEACNVYAGMPKDFSVSKILGLD